MNELDFLAWLILGCCVVLIVLPVLISHFTDSYLDAVCLGVGLINLIALFAALVMSALWALDRVIG